MVRNGSTFCLSAALVICHLQFDALPLRQRTQRRAFLVTFCAEQKVTPSCGKQQNKI